MTEETIFAEALEKKTPSDRTAYLDQACAGDGVLRQRMETLLQSHDVEDSFLGKPAIQCAAEELAGQASTGDTQDELPGDGGNEALDFLVASDKPGTLGRLGHYEVLEVIGRGGMGVVLRAFDEKLHRVVAIKVMAAQLAANGTARKRFTREAQAAAAVSHDHIVTIHAVEETAGHPYLVMQYVSGMSLQERLDRNGPLQLAEIVRIGMQTAAGLAAAHAQGLVHRDVKPANILLENGIERVKITDFGLARAAADASLTQSGVITGTPYFMSPEQARGEPVDQRTDLFSLGSVLYAMCTGHAPFRASGTMAVLKRVCEETPRPIRESNPDVPDWLVAIIERLHAKDPAERFQTAKEVAELLGEHLADVQAGRAEGRKAAVETTAADAINRPLTGLGSTKPRRNWLRAGAALGCVVLLAGTALYFNPFRTRHGAVLHAEDVLPQLVGTWSIDVETTLPKQDPAKGIVRFDWIANEKFLRSYTTYDQGSETLTVHRYAGDGTNFKRWFLSSHTAIHAIQSGIDGEWDMKTQTMTYRGTLPLWHKITHVERWVDVNHVEITTEIKDALGEVTLRQTKKMQRTQDMAVGPKAPVDPKRPAEFALLDRQVGTWNNTVDVTLAELGGKKFQSRTTNKAAPILAHRFVESYEKHEHGDRMEYWLLGYDEFRRIYRLWHFGGDGEAMEADCAWDDPKEKTLTWKSLGGRFTGTWTFPNDDERHATMSAKDAQGRPLFDVTGISRRDGAAAGNDGWVQLFNGTSLDGWKKHPDDTKNVWTVEDGAIVALGGGTSYLFSERGDFENFQLRAQAKINPTGDAGVIFRTAFALRATKDKSLERMSGYEAQIGVRTNWPVHTGSLTWPLGHTAAEGVLKQGPPNPHRPDEWFLLEIIARGPDMQTLVNGQPTAQYRDATEQYRRGHLALQSWGASITTVHFKKIEIKELPPSKSAEVAQPFIILPKEAKAEQKFATLAAAVDKAQSGDTIEVRGNGPFVSEPINIQRTALTIRAGAGFRPVIKLSPEAIRHNVALLKSTAALVLEGLELHRAPWGDWPIVVHIHEAPLRAANCRFRSKVTATHSPVCVFRNCEFQSLEGNQGGQHPPGARVSFDNCLLWATWGGIGLNYDPALQDIAIQVERSTIVTGLEAFRLSLPNPLSGSDSPQGLQPIRLEVSGCLIDTVNTLGFAQSRDKTAVLKPAEAEATLLRLFRWRGERNLFAPGSTSVRWTIDGKGEPPYGPTSLADWKRFWGVEETGSLEGRVRFQGGDLRARTAADLDLLRPDDFRLNPDSPGFKAGKDGKDLGADVDLVGPGPAYERWKKTPEYQQWLNDTKQAK